MKQEVMVKKEIDAKFISINLPVRYGDEDIAFDFPLRDGDVWQATVEIDSGNIKGWPAGKSGSLYMKVTDSGVYTIYDLDMNELAKLNDYVPHGIVPGEYGDYVNLEIDETGHILNWSPRNLDDFFTSVDD